MNSSIFNEALFNKSGCVDFRTATAPLPSDMQGGGLNPRDILSTYTNDKWVEVISELKKLTPHKLLDLLAIIVVVTGTSNTSVQQKVEKELPYKINPNKNSLIKKLFSTEAEQLPKVLHPVRAFLQSGDFDTSELELLDIYQAGSALSGSNKTTDLQAFSSLNISDRNRIAEQILSSSGCSFNSVLEALTKRILLPEEARRGGRAHIVCGSNREISAKTDATAYAVVSSCLRISKRLHQASPNDNTNEFQKVLDAGSLCLIAIAKSNSKEMVLEHLTDSIDKLTCQNTRESRIKELGLLLSIYDFVSDLYTSVRREVRPTQMKSQVLDLQILASTFSSEQLLKFLSLDQPNKNGKSFSTVNTIQLLKILNIDPNNPELKKVTVQSRNSKKEKLVEVTSEVRKKFCEQIIDGAIEALANGQFKAFYYKVQRLIPEVLGLPPSGDVQQNFETRLNEVLGQKEVSQKVQQSQFAVKINDLQKYLGRLLRSNDPNVYTPLFLKVAPDFYTKNQDDNKYTKITPEEALQLDEERVYVRFRQLNIDLTSQTTYCKVSTLKPRPNTYAGPCLEITRGSGTLSSSYFVQVDTFGKLFKSFIGEQANSDTVTSKNYQEAMKFLKDLQGFIVESNKFEFIGNDGASTQNEFACFSITSISFKRLDSDLKQKKVKITNQVKKGESIDDVVVPHLGSLVLEISLKQRESDQTETKEITVPELHDLLVKSNSQFQIPDSVLDNCRKRTST
jgi:hypothetical protein